MEQQCWVFEIARNKSNIPVVVWVSIKGKRTPQWWGCVQESEPWKFKENVWYYDMSFEFQLLEHLFSITPSHNVLFHSPCI
jgi:hypothetical protein